MIFRFVTFLFLFSFMLTACKNEAKNNYDSSVIDREKLDAAFSTNESKILFNHLYVVVDSLTYADIIKSSSWNNSYASIDSGLPDFSPLGKNTSSCYLRGHKHYIEILGPNNRFNEPVGKSGIGFSLANQDEHFHLGIKPKLKNDSVPFLSSSNVVKMPINNKEETWFKAFYTPSKGTALHTWYAFYNPDFLNELHGKSHQYYLRETFLENAYEEEKLFKGVKTITMLCTVEDYKRIGQELRHLGAKLADRKHDTLVIASGDIEIKIAHSNNITYSHITQIECQLNTKDKSETQLGNIKIKNEGTQSVWDLKGLYNKNNTEN